MAALPPILYQNQSSRQASVLKQTRTSRISTRFGSIYSSSSYTGMSISRKLEARLSDLSDFLRLDGGDIAREAAAMALYISSSLPGIRRSVALIENLSEKPGIQEYPEPQRNPDEPLFILSAKREGFEPLSGQDWEQWQQAHMIRFSENTTFEEKFWNFFSRNQYVGIHFPVFENMREKLLSYRQEKRMRQEAVTDGLFILKQMIQAKKENPNLELVYIEALDVGPNASDKKLILIHPQPRLFSCLKPPAKKTQAAQPEKANSPAPCPPDAW